MCRTTSREGVLHTWDSLEDRRGGTVGGSACQDAALLRGYRFDLACGTDGVRVPALRLARAGADRVHPASQTDGVDAGADPGSGRGRRAGDAERGSPALGRASGAEAGGDRAEAGGATSL